MAAFMMFTTVQQQRSIYLQSDPSLKKAHEHWTQKIICL
jgi:hypothetical protein